MAWFRTPGFVPIPAVRGTLIEPRESTLLGHSGFPLGMGLPAPKLPIMIANRWSDRLEIGHSIWRAVVQGVYERQQRRQVHLEFDRE